MSQSIQVERDILRSARFQHSLLTQSVKQDAIDRMVEQSLGLAKEPLSIDDILTSSSLEFDGNIQVLRITETRAAIERLKRRGRLHVSKTLTVDKYALTRKAKNEFSNLKVESERRAHRIAVKLFKNLDPDPDSMIAPFFDLLTKVFSQLSGTYIAILTGRENRSAFLSGKELATVIQEVVEKHHITPGLVFSSFLLFLRRSSRRVFHHVRNSPCQSPVANARATPARRLAARCSVVLALAKYCYVTSGIFGQGDGLAAAPRAYAAGRVRIVWQVYRGV